MANDFYSEIINNKKQQIFPLFNAKEVRSFVKELFDTLFIVTKKKEQEMELNQQFIMLQNKLQQILLFAFKNEIDATHHSTLFFEVLPSLYTSLCLDATAIFNADPAAKSIEEVISCYPGFYSIAMYRIAHQLQLQNIELLPRIITEYAHSKTGIDIHPAATIGTSFVIDHGTGIVIGETTIIGDQVKMYQGVTLGALSVQKEKATIKRHPTIQNNVVIYSGATILGGDTIIGRDSVIGGNVWLTKSILPFSIVYHTAEVTIQDKNSFKEPVDFFI
jgi:serine O-acetyltransferase